MLWAAACDDIRPVDNPNDCLIAHTSKEKVANLVADKCYSDCVSL